MSLRRPPTFVFAIIRTSLGLLTTEPSRRCFHHHPLQRRRYRHAAPAPALIHRSAVLPRKLLHAQQSVDLPCARPACSRGRIIAHRCSRSATRNIYSATALHQGSQVPDYNAPSGIKPGKIHHAQPHRTAHTHHKHNPICCAGPRPHPGAPLAPALFLPTHCARCVLSATFLPACRSTE